MDLVSPELRPLRDSSPPLLWIPSPPVLELEPGAIHVLAFDLDAPAPGIETLEPTLSPDERARAAKLKCARDRSRYVAGRGLMRSVLAHYLGTVAGRLRFAYGANGKPALAGADAASGLRFNQSGSEGVGILAVGLEAEVGVDVERVRPIRDALSVAERVFAPAEFEALRSRRPEELAAAFFSVWTRREAVVKCVGSGLSFPTPSFAVVASPADTAEQVPLTTSGGLENLWVRLLPAPREGFMAALATAIDPARVKCFRWGPLSALPDAAERARRS